MTDDQKNPLLHYIVNNPEAFAHNLARIVENAGKAMAAYVEPREKGEIKPEMAEELNVRCTGNHVHGECLGGTLVRK